MSMTLRHIGAIATSGEKYISRAFLGGDTECAMVEADDAFNEWMSAYEKSVGGEKADDALLIILRMAGTQNQFYYEKGFCDGVKLERAIEAGHTPPEQLLCVAPLGQRKAVTT